MRNAPAKPELARKLQEALDPLPDASTKRGGIKQDQINIAVSKLNEAWSVNGKNILNEFKNILYKEGYEITDDENFIYSMYAILNYIDRIDQVRRNERPKHDDEEIKDMNRFRDTFPKQFSVKSPYVDKSYFPEFPDPFVQPDKGKVRIHTNYTRKQYKDFTVDKKQLLALVSSTNATEVCTLIAEFDSDYSSGKYKYRVPMHFNGIEFDAFPIYVYGKADPDYAQDLAAAQTKR